MLLNLQAHHKPLLSHFVRQLQLQDSLLYSETIKSLEGLTNHNLLFRALHKNVLCGMGRRAHAEITWYYNNPHGEYLSPKPHRLSSDKRGLSAALWIAFRTDLYSSSCVKVQ